MWNAILDAVSWLVQAVGWTGVAIGAAVIVYVIVAEWFERSVCRQARRDPAIGCDQTRRERQRQLRELQARIAATDPRRV